MAECRDCGRTYEYDRSKGHRKTRCNSCRQKKKRVKRREMLVERLGGECEECGYNECERALDFHHTNPEEKNFQISGNETRAKEDVLNEADKCVLLCKNCHTRHDCEHCRFDAAVG